MSYPAFVATVEDAFLDEEVNARGELSERQHDAVMQEARGRPVDLTLRRVDGTLLEWAAPQRVLVGDTTGIPVRQGLTLLMGKYVCFVTKRPQLVVGIARPKLAPVEIVKNYREALLRSQRATQADLDVNDLGVLSPCQRRQKSRAVLGSGGALLLMLGLLLNLQVEMGWDPLALCLNGIIDPFCLFGLYWLIRNWFPLTRSPVLVTEGKVSSRRLPTKTNVGSITIGDVEVEFIARALPGLPYRLYWNPDPRQPRRNGAPLPSHSQSPYRSGPEGDGEPAPRPKVYRFVALDLSEQPLAP